MEPYTKNGKTPQWWYRGVSKVMAFFWMDNQPPTAWTYV
jgi:hypothetical protein